MGSEMCIRDRLGGGRSVRVVVRAYESRAVAASSRLSPRVARGVRFWNLPAARRRRGGGLGAAPPARPLGRPLLGRLLGRGASFARNVRASGVRFPRRLFLSGPGRTPPVAAAPRPAVAPARLLGVSVRAGRGDGERHGVAGRAARGSRGGESGRERRLPVGVAIAIGVARRDSARPPRLAVAVHLGGRGIVQVVPVPVRVGRGTETRGFFKTHVSRRVTGSTSIASRSSESRFRSGSAFLRNVRRRARSRNRILCVGSAVFRTRSGSEPPRCTVTAARVSWLIAARLSAPPGGHAFGDGVHAQVALPRGAPGLERRVDAVPSAATGASRARASRGGAP